MKKKSKKKKKKNHWEICWTKKVLAPDLEGLIVGEKLVHLKTLSRRKIRPFLYFWLIKIVNSSLN